MLVKSDIILKSSLGNSKVYNNQRRKRRRPPLIEFTKKYINLPYNPSYYSISNEIILSLILGLLITTVVSGIEPEQNSTNNGFLDFDNLPVTRFSCDGKVIGGYYADVEAGCQMFHVCTLGQKDEIQDIKFLCLNGTVFDQETRVCERVDEVDCSMAEKYYDLNLDLYLTQPSTTTTTTTTTTPPPPLRVTTSPQQQYTQKYKPFSSYTYFTRGQGGDSPQNSQLRQSYLINHDGRSSSVEPRAPTARKVGGGSNRNVPVTTNRGVSNPSREHDEGSSEIVASDEDSSLELRSGNAQRQEQQSFKPQESIRQQQQQSLQQQQQHSIKQQQQQSLQQQQQHSIKQHHISTTLQHQQHGPTSTTIRSTLVPPTLRPAAAYNSLGAGAAAQQQSSSSSLEEEDEYDEYEDSEELSSTLQDNNPSIIEHNPPPRVSTTVDTHRPRPEQPQPTTKPLPPQPTEELRHLTTGNLNNNLRYGAVNRQYLNITQTTTEEPLYYEDEYVDGAGEREYNYDESINPNEHHFSHVDVPRIPYAKPNMPRVLVTNGKPFLPRLRRHQLQHLFYNNNWV